MFGWVIIACWFVFVLYWILSARGVKAAAVRQSWPGILVHRLPVLLGAILLFWPKLPGPLGREVTPQAVVVGTLGAAICGLGLLAAIWSRRALADNWSSTVVFKERHELVERGPYRWVRHPIYASILLMCLGTAVAANRAGSIAGMLFYFAGFWIKLKQEEKLLRRHFPDDYPSYQARVKALVPFLF